MIIVCLDQCAISELARPLGVGSPLDKLREMLLDACKQLKVVCPVALETIVETTGLQSREHRIAIYELHSRLADARLGGPVWAFKNMWKMIDEETLALARSEAPPSAFDLIQWHRADDDKLAAETWRGVVAGKQRMFERVQSHRLISIDGEATLEVTKKGIVLAEEHAGHVYRQIKRLLDGEDLDASDHMGYGLAVYLQQRGIQRSELEKLIQDILYHRWEAIPVIFNRTQIAARLETDYRRANTPRNYDVNDEFDIPRLAVGLSSADLIITDGAMAQLCHTIKSTRWSAAQVFAIRDTSRILEYLRTALAENTDDIATDRTSVSLAQKPNQGTRRPRRFLRPINSSSPGISSSR